MKRHTVVEGNFDLTVSLDTEKAKLWQGGTVFLYVLGNFGEAATGIVGNTRATSNIEAPETIKLYEAWYNQDFAEGKLSLLVGLHDYNSEFNALEYSGGLRHSSFGIEPDISQVGPSIFPTAALATRVKNHLQLRESIFKLLPMMEFREIQITTVELMWISAVITECFGPVSRGSHLH